VIAARRTVKAMRGVSAKKLTAKTLGSLSGSSRFVLANPQQVKRSVRARTASQVSGRSDFDYYKGDYWEGHNLKKGIEGMAERVSNVLTDEELRKIRAMGSEELSALYQNNKMVFDVAFNYNGVEKNARGAFDIDESKADDMRFLIDQYERYYGVL